MIFIRFFTMGEKPHGFLVVIEYDVIEYGVVVRGDFPPGKIHIHVGIHIVY